LQHSWGFKGIRCFKGLITRKRTTYKGEITFMSEESITMEESTCCRTVIILHKRPTTKQRYHHTSPHPHPGVSISCYGVPN
jgi:hypothetical protein